MKVTLILDLSNRFDFLLVRTMSGLVIDFSPHHMQCRKKKFILYGKLTAHNNLLQSVTQLCLKA